MRSKKIFIYMSLTGLLLSSFQVMKGQEAWDLERCLKYAWEHNISMKRQKIITTLSKESWRQEQWKSLPSFNMGSSLNANFGRSIDQETNGVTYSQNINNQYWLNSSLLLFQGWAHQNQVKAARYLYQSKMKQEAVQRNLVGLDILFAYFKVLLAEGLNEIAQGQYAISKKQFHQVEVKVQTGRLPKTEIYLMESLVARDKLTVVEAQNAFELAITELRQLLELPGDKAFRISNDGMGLDLFGQLYQVDSVYRQALNVLPRLEAREWDIKASKKNLSASRGSQLPQISFQGGLGTGYYNSNRDDSNTTPSFRDQIDEKFYQSLGLRLSIPLFNGLSARKNTQKAKLRLEDAFLALDQEKEVLYKKIFIAIQEYNACKERFRVAMENKEAHEKVFLTERRRYETGLGNGMDFQTTKTRLLNAQVEVKKVQYECLFKERLIKFYVTGSLF